MFTAHWQIKTSANLISIFFSPLKLKCQPKHSFRRLKKCCRIGINFFWWVSQKTGVRLSSKDCADTKFSLLLGLPSNQQLYMYLWTMMIFVFVKFNPQDILHYIQVNIVLLKVADTTNTSFWLHWWDMLRKRLTNKLHQVSSGLERSPGVLRHWHHCDEVFILRWIFSLHPLLKQLLFKRNGLPQTTVAFLGNVPGELWSPWRLSLRLDNVSAGSSTHFPFTPLP